MQKLYLKATDAGASVDDLVSLITQHFTPPDDSDSAPTEQQQQQQDGTQVRKG